MNYDLSKLNAAKARLDVADAAWLALLELNDLAGAEEALIEMRAARAAMLELLTPPPRAGAAVARSIRGFLDDPRMADDYNPETGENDGIKYWERPGWEPGHDPG